MSRRSSDVVDVRSLSRRTYITYISVTKLIWKKIIRIIIKTKFWVWDEELKSRQNRKFSKENNKIFHYLNSKSRILTFRAKDFHQNTDCVIWVVKYPMVLCAISCTTDTWLAVATLAGNFSVLQLAHPLLFLICIW